MKNKEKSFVENKEKTVPGRQNTASLYRNNQIFQHIRIGIFCCIVILEIFIFFLKFDKTVTFWNIPFWLLVLIIELVFTVNNFVKIFVLKQFSHKITCYVIDFLMQFALTWLINSTYLSAIYILVLSEFYMSTDRIGDSIGMGVASLVIYVLTYGVGSYHFTQAGVWAIITSCFVEILLIILHFFVVNFALNAYDSKQKISKSLQELDESNRKLQQAYDELAEVTVLQERQRIAKDIHDTAGHSITTVIMQTEAAKLIVEENPAEAKRKIVAANLQAKNALEELRESVHLLAGDVSHNSLKDELERVVHDSCDGTDVIIRADIEDVICSDAKRRFLTNTLKEGVSNGLRHGHATAFYFELKRKKNEISFLLSDNGTGADMFKLKNGFGLKSMRRRAESFGGKLYLSSMPEEGFEIRLILPVDEIRDEGAVNGNKE